MSIRAYSCRAVSAVGLTAVGLTAVALTGSALPDAPAQSEQAQSALAVAVHGFQQDVDSDGHPDLLAATAAGTLHLYRADGSGGFLARRKLPMNWRGADQIVIAGDRDGDGANDVVARSERTGDLYLYPGDGTGGFEPRRRIGTGWQGLSEIVAPGDWDGDGNVDLLGVRRSDMTLWLYPGDGTGGFEARRRIGTGWQVRTTLTAVGDWDGDGHVDFVARDGRTGDLWLYPGNGRGGFGDYRAIGHGWNSLSALVGPGDWDGDGNVDLLGRDEAGRLVLYRGTGRGGFAPSYPVIGTGWNPLLLNGFRGYQSSSSSVSAAQLPSSYRAGCPVGPSSLRMLHLTYYGFDDHAHTGSMVVHSSVATRVRRAFGKLYAARFPIRRMQPVDVYSGSDDRSMAADNTSAFNCRKVSGSTSWSEHAYGEAVDINTVENPYVVGSDVQPPAGRSFLTRSTYRRGMIRGGEIVVRAFAAEGWGWGGFWSGSKDYQHLSASGR